jgi:hypothetical protein
MEPSLSHDARDTARSILGEQQQAAARSLGSMAGALRRAAGEQANGDGPSRLAESAADGLQRLSEALRSRDLDTLVRDTENFARRQPAVFIGAAALAGFLAVRFLKSTHRSDDRR